MAKLSSELVKKIAHLANLSLSGPEESTFASQLSKIVNYVNELSMLDTSNTESTFVPIDIDIENVVRSDEPQACLSQEETLKNAPLVKNGMFETKKWKFQN